VQQADVAIIGAGVIGCSIAYFLCQRGITRVVLIEKEDFPGTGSTSKANGGIRAQFTTAANIRMSLLSMDQLDSMEDEMREQSGYLKAGYLFLTAAKPTFDQLRRTVSFQRHLGVAVDLLSAQELRDRLAYCRTDDLVGGSFGARDGFIDPGGLTNAFYTRALNKGAVMLSRTRATGLIFSGRRVVGVETDRGSIAASWVVNAAGPFARQVAGWAGVDLPVRPIRSNIAVTGPTPDWPRRIPMTIDMDTGLLVRREGRGCALAWTDPNEPAGFDARFDPDFIERIAPKVETRFPRLMEAGIDFSRCWAGLYPDTPDHHAILGESGVGGFLLATGLGGHGVMHSPAVGLLLSEWIATGRAESLDLSPFALKRFETGDLNRELASL